MAIGTQEFSSLFTRSKHLLLNQKQSLLLPPAQMEAQGNRTKSELPSGTPRRIPASRVPLVQLQVGHTPHTAAKGHRSHTYSVSPALPQSAGISSVAAPWARSGRWCLCCGCQTETCHLLPLQLPAESSYGSVRRGSYVSKGACRDPLSSYSKCKPSGRCCRPHPVLLNWFLLFTSQTE